MDIKGGSAIVTGGATGLGFATARRLAEAGAHVISLDLPDSDGAAAAAALSGSAGFAPADVTDEDAVAAAYDLAEEPGAAPGGGQLRGGGNAGAGPDQGGRSHAARGIPQDYRCQRRWVVQRDPVGRRADGPDRPVDGERGVVLAEEGLSDLDRYRAGSVTERLESDLFLEPLEDSP